MHVPVEVTVELGRHTMSLRQALDLRPGSFVPANRLADEPVEVHVGGRAIAYGHVVVIDEELGVRITETAAARHSDPARWEEPPAAEIGPAFVDELPGLGAL